MPYDRLRVLHAIHDFLPRHRAGSEIYALELCKALGARHHVTLLCAEYDQSRRHGHLTWRVHDGISVVELINNWACQSFADTYRSPIIGDQIERVLEMVQPDVVHVHSLLNLSFDLPARAHAAGIPVVATLHDYTLVCPSGGQRVHKAERHLCNSIDTDRCVRCFRDSPFQTQMSFSAMASGTRRTSVVHRLASALNRRVPRVAAAVARAVLAADERSVTGAEIQTRLDAARRVFEEVDLFIAPSASIAEEFMRLGLPASKVRVSDYGFAPLKQGAGIRPRRGAAERLRIGFVGTLVWHKGVHVLIDAARSLPRDKYELIIFGDPKVFPEYAAELRRNAAGLPVRFQGSFERDETSRVYDQMDVLAVPSLWLENSPLVIHEAFMAGVPVVGARIGGIAGLIDESNGLLYDPPESAPALASVLRRLIEHPEQLAALAKKSPHVKSIEEDACEWEARYAEVIGGDHARRSLA